jgi:beta-xylosidase
MPDAGRTIERGRVAPRGRHLVLAGLAIGALALAACAPPATNTQATTTTRAPAPTTTLPPPPTAPGGISASPLLVNGLAQDFPDPFVLRVDDASQCGGDPAPCYYGYATESGLFGLLNVPLIRSSDRQDWNWAGPPEPGTTDPTKDAMPDLASWVEFGANWAPSVMLNTTLGKYVMYYTAKSASLGKECVGIATSSTPAGPFVDSSSGPALCNPAKGGTIDPDPYLDTATNSLYLTYADDDGIKAQRLNPNGLSLAGGETLILPRATGYSWEQQRVEGPSMFRAPDGTLTLLYSAGTFDTSSYSVGVAHCTTPLGPCAHTYSTPVLTSRGSMLGPGGQTPVQLPGGSWVLFFHAWDTVVGYPSGKRSLHQLPMSFPVNRPKIG